MVETLNHCHTVRRCFEKAGFIMLHMDPTEAMENDLNEQEEAIEAIKYGRRRSCTTPQWMQWHF